MKTSGNCSPGPHGLAKWMALVGLCLFSGCGGGGTLSPPNPGNTTSQLTLGPSALDFGDVDVGGSGTQAVSIQNTGNSSVTISQFTATGAGFSVSGLSAPMSMPAGQNASFNVTLAPSSAGGFSGSVSIISSATNSPHVLRLSGNGATSPLNATPSSVSFGDVAIGSSSTQTVTLINAGSHTIHITQATVTGTGFTISGLSTPAILPAGQNTTFTVKFTAQSTGSATGSVSVVSTAVNSPTTISLAANGASSSLSVNPTSLSFGNVVVGTSSTQTVTLSNTGTSNAVVSQANVTGAGFSISGLTLPLTLAGGQNKPFSVSFAPTTAGSATGGVSIVNGTTGSATTLSLSGNGVSLLLGASPSSLNFGDVALGASGTLTITLSNTGTGSVTVSQVNVTGAGFSTSGISPPATLPAGQNTTFTVKFAPSSTGSVTGNVSIVSNATNSPATVSLAGNGVASVLNASPTSLNFGNVLVGGNSTQTVTLTNAGAGGITISQVTPTGAAFSVGGITLPLTLGGGQNTTFSVTFAPSATGSVTGSVSVVSTASNSPTSLSLSGTGVSALLNASPSSLTFGDVVVNASSTRSVTLTNAGTSSVTVSQANVTGTGFSVSGLSLPFTLGASQSTGFTVAFAPTATGSVSGSVSVVSTASNSPTVVSLSGNGVTLLLGATPASIDFGNVAVGSNSTQTVTLTNNGTGSVTVSQANVTGAAFSVSGLSLPLTLTGGQNTTFSAKFAPSGAGGTTGSVSIVSNATNSPATVSLAGTGVVTAHSVDVSWNVSTSVVVGYNVYRATVSGGPYTKINASLVTGTVYTDTTAQAGQTYYYVATAVDASSVESVFSNEAQAVVPTP